MLVRCRCKQFALFADQNRARTARSYVDADDLAGF
jgi:hypothetical protein